jgi:hypothetical protein
MSRFYFNTEEKTITQKKGYVEVEDNYTQIYDNVLNLTTKLSSLLDLQILLYLSKNVNKHNVFNTNQLLHDNIQKTLNRTFTKMTFYNSLESLVKSKLIVKLTRGQYQINPLAIWRESQSLRAEIINAIIEGKEHPNYVIQVESESSIKE